MMSLLFPLLLLLLLFPVVVSIKDENLQVKEAEKYHSSYHNPINCVDFINGEDDGNKFRNLEECRRESTNKYLHKPRECSLPEMRGPCSGNFQRYYFNSKTGNCVEFFYGGCGGNQNNFCTLEECERKCLQPTPIELIKVECHSKPDPGPCMAEIKRFFYSPQTNNCFSFTYGGCGGNTNNFKNIEECLSSCRKMKAI